MDRESIDIEIPPLVLELDDLVDWSAHEARETDNDTEPIMDIAIRWSHSSGADDPHFLVTDVIGHTLKYCRVTGVENDSVQWREVSRNSNVPAFRAFDWAHRYGIAAVGQWSGETTIVGMSNSSPTLSLPVKSQRQCNAVSFNASGLLGTGLEKIRNDFCLNIYDVSQWVTRSPGGTQAAKHIVEPLRKLASSEGIMSIKFFNDAPYSLVTGVKGSGVRIYDLREDSGNPSLQYQTVCIHNIAIDPCDSNYFASASSNKDSLVSIWDRRSTARPAQSKGSARLHDGPLVELKDVFGGPKESDSASIWSLRYSVSERGSLGVLGSSSNLRVFHARKESIVEDESSSASDGKPGQYAEDIYINRIETIGKPSQHALRLGSRNIGNQDNSDHIRAFDFMNVTGDGNHQMIILRGNQEIERRKFYNPTSLFSPSRRNKIFSTAEKIALPPKSRLARPWNVFGVTEAEMTDTYLTKAQDQLARVALSTTADKSSKEDGWNDDMALRSVKDAIRAESFSTASKTKVPVGDALLLSSSFRRRSLEGYLFDAKKNIEIVYQSSELVEMWRWIGFAIDNAAGGRMICEAVDLSYLGISDIWNNRLGRTPETRIRPGATEIINVPQTVQKLVESLKLPELDMTDKTAKPHHRKLCLYCLGFYPEPLALVKEMTMNGHGIEAALYAIIMDDFAAAIIATRSGPQQSQKRQLSAAIHVFAEGASREQVLRLVDATLGDETDIFAKAIIAFICGKHWDEVLSSPSLPARYQAGLVLKLDPDVELSTYISNRTYGAMHDGDIRNILFTGLSEDAVDLFGSYIERTSDMQSAVLALSFTAPRFFQSNRVTHWRESFRGRLNALKHWYQRCRFDQQSIKLSEAWDGPSKIAPSKPQFRIRCNNCEQDVQQGAQLQSSNASSGQQTPSQASRVLGSDGTMCPRCGARLPRCAICEHWLGVVDTSSLGRARDSTIRNDDPFKDHMESCANCQHSYHRGCATGWFEEAGKVECPAEDCMCPCNTLDGPPRKNDA